MLLNKSYTKSTKGACLASFFFLSKLSPTTENQSNFFSNLSLSHSVFSIIILICTFTSTSCHRRWKSVWRWHYWGASCSFVHSSSLSSVIILLWLKPSWHDSCPKWLLGNSLLLSCVKVLFSILASLQSISDARVNPNPQAVLPHSLPLFSTVPPQPASC